MEKLILPDVRKKTFKEKRDECAERKKQARDYFKEFSDDRLEAYYWVIFRKDPQAFKVAYSLARRCKNEIKRRGL